MIAAAHVASWPQLSPGRRRIRAYRRARDGPNPLVTNTAFAAFQQGISERYEEGEGPNPQDATLVGEYRFFDR